jgi:Glycosyl hydrolase catalytic core/Concanavalin A-like lectin/glucanases superfamily/Ricin-type beta-trefoil lectin domain-like
MPLTKQNDECRFHYPWFQFEKASIMKNPNRSRGLAAGCCSLLVFIMPMLVSAQTLTHRYSFFNEPNGSLTATDLVASANGTLQGGAVITGGQLVLNGASGTYLNLPGGLITGDSAVTVEAWADFGNLPVNCYLFSFGNTDGGGAGENYIFCAPQAARITISGVDPGYTGEQNAAGGSWSGLQNLHVVAIYNPPAHSLAVYTNGVLAGINTAETVSLASVNDVYSYLGRSLYTADPYAPLNVDEFRIYNGALSAQQVALDAASGPGQIITNPGALLSVQLVLTNQMSAGSRQPAVVTGNFANVTNVNLFTYGPTAVVSDNTNVLTISSSGLVTATMPGAMANIIATYGGLSATQSVTVAGFATNRFVFDTFGDGFWTIVNQGNTNPLVASFSGASQEAFTNGATEQQFEVLYNLQNGTFRLRQRSSWYCIGAQNNHAVPGAGVPLGIFYTSASAQQWYLVDSGGGYFRIFNAASNLVLQTDNGTPANVTLAAPSASPFQLWQFNYQTHYPKKGTAGYEGSPFQSEFGTWWAYNYDDNTGASEPSYFDFVPMIWGQYWEPLSDVQSRAVGWRSSRQPVYLLTYNEPDNSSQANMTTAQVIGLWPQLQALGVPLVSPAMQNTYSAWAYNFFSLIASNNYRVDYTAVHLYVNPDATALINNLQNVYNTWGRPVWLTEFSPVDWTGTATWSEQDDYNFLAEFMWQAEDQLWLKRYGLFPFSGTPSTNPWDANGHRGDTFLADGVTLTPYGELFATWGADRTLHARMPYLIQNLATSFRLTSSNSVSAPRASSIRVRNATTEWALLAAPTSNRWFIISLNDGRRLRDTLGTLDLAPVGTVGSLVEWTFTGPDSKGYYYIGNPTGAHNLNGSGTAPSVTFGTVSSVTQNNNTRWRLIKPYQPVSIPATTVPVTLSATPSNQNVTLSWSGGNRFYNVYRGTATGGPYTRIATTLTNTTFIDNTVTNGVPCYYVVTGLNILGEESGYSAEAAATASVAAAWRLQWFGTPYNIGIAADTADLDGDGIVNVLERAFNLNPTVADTNGKPAGALDGANFILTYRKSLAATDLFFQVMRSFDLIQWSTNGVTDTVVSSDGSTEIHAASVPLSNGSAQFLRLQVTAP